jgi:hypothetical protein
MGNGGGEIIGGILLAKIVVWGKGFCSESSIAGRGRL